MGSIKYYLNKGKGTKSARPIMIGYHFNGQRLFYFTGLHIAENEFNRLSKDKPAKAECIDRIFINNRLLLIRRAIGEIENEALAAGEILTVELFRDRLNKRLKQKPEKATARVSLLDFFDLYISELPNKINPITGAKLSKAMPIKYKSVRNLFEDFCTYTGREWDFDDIDDTFISRFIAYMLDQKNYAVNTYGRILKFLKTVLHEASKRGYNTSTKYKAIITGISEPAAGIYLSEAELQSIYSLDLSGLPGLDRVRDLFLVGCWTGLRFSDYTSISKADIQGDRIRIQAKKTKQLVSIPVHPVVRSILEKYKYQLPKAISNQKFNAGLKDIAEMAGIIETTVTRITKSGRVETQAREKYNLVSSHVARRSFATNALIRGVEPMLIMAITGHKTEAEFRKYVKIDKEQKADLFAQRANW